MYILTRNSLPNNTTLLILYNFNNTNNYLDIEVNLVKLLIVVFIMSCIFSFCYSKFKNN